jgi:uncharacterized protein (TIGR00251 family)
MKTLTEIFTEFQKNNRIVLRVKVLPRAQKNVIIGLLENNTLKIRIAAKPEHGRANCELIKFLATEFNANKVKILSGAKEPLKLICLEN